MLKFTAHAIELLTDKTATLVCPLGILTYLLKSNGSCIGKKVCSRSNAMPGHALSPRAEIEI